MTLLNFNLTRDQVQIFMDSLCVDGDRKEPRSFVSKIFPLPHLNGVICGTGLNQLITEWFVLANTEMLVRNFTHLDQFTPRYLKMLYDKYTVEFPSYTFTSTIYHFGYDDSEERFRGYAYRSTNEFLSEELSYGLGIKPPPLEVDKFLPIQSFDDMIRLMEEQKLEDEACSFEERVGIGGDIHYFSMDAQQMSLQRCYRFPDYEKMYLKMCENFAA